MKKAINKTERNAILIALVAEASTKSAQKIVNKLGELRLELHKVLLTNWQKKMPGISRKDQLELLQSNGGRSLTFEPYMRKQEPGKDHHASSGAFGTLTWRNEGSDSVKARRAQLMTKILSNCSGVARVLSDGVNTNWQARLSIPHSFPDIIAGFQPSYVYDDSCKQPQDSNKAYNFLLLTLHCKIDTLLREMRALLESAEEMYENLGAAIAPVKNAEELAKLFPEAVKHFPDSLTYVKPTKEIADPKAINDIRAKLAKGLPI